MEDKKRQPRGLKEVSQLFLSSQNPEDEENVSEKKVRKDTKKAEPVQHEIPRKEQPDGSLSTVPKGHGLSFVFISSASFFAESSFLASNLSLELGRRNFSVALIETTSKLPNTFFHLGPFFPESKAREIVSPPEKKSPTALQTVSEPASSQPFDIPIGSKMSIKAFFWKETSQNEDSFKILNALKRETDFVIINAPPGFSEIKKLISFMDPFFVFPTTVESKCLLSTYLGIKQVSQEMSCDEMGLFFMEEGLPQKSKGAFKVLSEMANTFLSCRVHFLGTLLKGTDFFQSILSRTPALLKGVDSPLSQGVRQLADNLVRKASHLKETDNGEDNF